MLSPTPYLGGAAVLAGVLLTVLPQGGAADRFAAILACAAILWLIGTIDDRINLSPVWRLLAEIGVGVIIWSTHLGFTAFGSDALNLGSTVLWIVAIVNAFNLMDNIDGACAILAAISAAGIAAAAIAGGDTTLGAVAVAVTGACMGFLRHNLARPARLFLGDGGSMPLGLLIADLGAGAGAKPRSGRRRAVCLRPVRRVAGARFGSGGDLATTPARQCAHRRPGPPHPSTAAQVGTSGRVVLVLGAVQAAVVTLAAVADQVGANALIATGGSAVALGARIVVCRLEARVGAPAVIADRRPACPECFKTGICAEGRAGERDG